MNNKELTASELDCVFRTTEALRDYIMYGPPEVIFSPKKLAEKRLRNEIMQQVLRTELTAEQWREIVADLVMDDNCDHRLIEDLIKDNNNQ